MPSETDDECLQRLWAALCSAAWRYGCKKRTRSVCSEVMRRTTRHPWNTATIPSKSRLLQVSEGAGENLQGTGTRRWTGPGGMQLGRYEEGLGSWGEGGSVPTLGHSRRAAGPTGNP